jgi:hypothetical protein
MAISLGMRDRTGESVSAPDRTPGRLAIVEALQQHQ